MFPKSSPHICYLPIQRPNKSTTVKHGTRSKSKFRKYIDHPVQNSIIKLSDYHSILPTSVYNQIEKLQRVTLHQIQSLQINPSINQQLDFYKLKSAVLMYQSNLHHLSPKPKILIEEELTKNNNLFHEEEQMNYHLNAEYSDSLQHQIELNNIMRLQSDSNQRDISKRFKTQNNILYFHDQSPMFD